MHAIFLSFFSSCFCLLFSSDSTSNNLCGTVPPEVEALSGKSKFSIQSGNSNLGFACGVPTRHPTMQPSVGPTEPSSQPTPPPTKKVCVLCVFVHFCVHHFRFEFPLISQPFLRRCRPKPTPRPSMEPTFDVSTNAFERLRFVFSFNFIHHKYAVSFETFHLPVFLSLSPHRSLRSRRRRCPHDGPLLCPRSR
jgi:hypothetical protein